MKTQDASQRKSGVWDIDQAIATIDTKEFAGSVNIDQPEAGVQVERVFENSVSESSILAFAHAPAVDRVNVDQYLRGEDLVCRYRSRDASDSSGNDQLLSDQVYWRHVASKSSPDCGGVELVVSLQTDRLDLQPRIELNSSLVADSVSLIRFREQPSSADAGTKLKIEPVNGSLDCDPSGAIALLVKSEAGDWSYLQGLHFTDEESCDRIRVESSDGRVTISVLLFVEHLEKGVIRRARLRGSFLNSVKVDDPVLTDWFDAFATSELPLTV